jgi:hypothetical protein
MLKSGHARRPSFNTWGGGYSATIPIPSDFEGDTPISVTVKQKPSKTRQEQQKIPRKPSMPIE